MYWEAATFSTMFITKMLTLGSTSLAANMFVIPPPVESLVTVGLGKF